mgnify:CR=1 FL=1
MLEATTLTRPQLATALLAWELAHRNGQTRPYAEALALPAEQVADEGARYLWTLLAPADGAAPIAVPPIAQPWPGQGGIYCGLVRGVDGQPDHHLILALARPPKRLKWQAALDWAATVGAEGHADFDLPTPAENAVLFGNVPELFERTWYWSNKAEGASYAWDCYFGIGTQYYGDRGFEGSAVAVRRLPVGPSVLWADEAATAAVA